MSDTPKTDYLEQQLCNAAHPSAMRFCRDLERENAELKRQVKHMDKYLRAVDAATDIETARRRANKGLNMKGGEV